MKPFLDKNFLLNNEMSKHLFYDYCKDMPICDYHCHLSPKEIYENKPITNITDLWLGGDHYKWRLMRSAGIDECYCTGTSDNEEKFKKFAHALQYAIGNPIFHWSHLELQRYFNIDLLLCSDTAEKIYEMANNEMADGSFTPQHLIKKSNVKYVCTTDDPVDDLEYHKLMKDANDTGAKILPTFRPDKALNIDMPGFSQYIKSLSIATGIDIKTYEDVIEALYKRADYFNELGCRISDEAFYDIPFKKAPSTEIQKAFQHAMNGEQIGHAEAEIYKTAIAVALGEKYHSLGWAMEIHIGAMRNNNKIMYDTIGPDTGFDSVADCNIAYKLSRFLDELASKNKLPKTILFNLNGKDNDVLASMLGNFQNSDAESKIQFGPAWWFLDNIDGITNQLKFLGNYGVLGKFIGMETDSRSFTSYARHEYFRRILCQLLGSWVEEGMYPDNETLLEEITKGICYNNAVKYFGFD